MRRVIRWIPGALLTCALIIRPLHGQAVGTLIVAHGADSAWNAAVLDLARQSHPGGPVKVAFLMGPGAARHRFQDAVDSLASAGATTVVVVPLLVSSHSGHYEQVRYLTGATDTLDSAMRAHLAMAGIERPPPGVRLVLTQSLDDAPELARTLADRARALAPKPRYQALMLIGHGPNSAQDNAAWMANLRAVAESIRVRTGFRDVKVGLVRDDAPAGVRAEAVLEIRELITLEAEATGKPVAVVPILIAGGTMLNSTVPHDLEGLPIVYGATALLPHPDMARWVERRVREAVAGH